jgi:uncharacterized protein (DUF697 family)
MTRKPLPKVIPPRAAGNLRSIAASVTVDEKAPHDSYESEPAAPDFAGPAANDQFAEASIYPSWLAAKRCALARKIVARHKNYAALGGLVPLPVVNIASVTAINLRMVKQLSELYGVPFQHDRTRALIVGLIGGAVPTGVGAAACSTLMWIVPGGLLLGLGASAVTAGALTRGIGSVFIEHFEGTAAGLCTAAGKKAI